MAAKFIRHAAARAIYMPVACTFQQKRGAHEQLLHHTLLFLSIFYVEYTMIRNTLWKRVFVTTFPEGSENIVYITIFIVSNRYFVVTRPKKWYKKTSLGKS